MAVQAYITKRFIGESFQLIKQMNAIVAEYVADGFRLTVRQLYYQLVARAIVPNTEKSYKRVVNTTNDAKLAGLMDWDAIEDRTRRFIRRSRWTTAAELVRAAAEQFHMDLWEGQSHRVFALVEKEALAGVLEPTCSKYDVPLLAARGYPSGTVLREFCVGQLAQALRGKQSVLILHLGDHDPSGIDMTRDLADRIRLFSEEFGHDVMMKRIALNMDQVRQQKPPPNPAKTTDSRFHDYERLYGRESWELDALNPRYLAKLVTGEIEAVINKTKWNKRKKLIEEKRTRLLEAADMFDREAV